MSDPKLTVSETAQVAWYVARMAKRSIASETVHMGDLERKVEQVIEKARRREEQDKQR